MKFIKPNLRKKEINLQLTETATVRDFTVYELYHRQLSKIYNQFVR